MINVSEVVSDHDFVQTITLKRRSGEFTGVGEWEVSESSTDISAVVQAASGETIAENSPDAVRVTRACMVWYVDELKAETNEGQQADHLIIDGQRYKVTKLLNNGAHGYWRAYCEGVNNG